MKKDIQTIDKQLAMIDDAKANIENTFINKNDKLGRMATEQNDIATMAKRNQKLIKSIEVPDINKTNKTQQIEIQDLQMRTTVLEELAQSLKRRIQKTERDTSDIDQVLTGLAMKPPPQFPDEVLQPINEHIDNFPLLLKDINSQFRKINDRIKQTKKWLELIPNINGRLKIVENSTKPVIVTKYIKGLYP